MEARKTPPRPDQIEKRVTSPQGQDIVLFRGGYSIFSNFRSNPEQFKIDDIWYNSVEQYYQSEKAKRYGDHKTVILISKLRSPYRMNMAGRSVANYDDEDFQQVSYNILLRGIKEKFLHDEKARKHLLSTGSAVIANAYGGDTYYGIGLDIEDPRANDIANWPGANKLGEILMKVREIVGRLE